MLTPFCASKLSVEAFCNVLVVLSYFMPLLSALFFGD